MHCYRNTDRRNHQSACQRRNHRRIAHYPPKPAPPRPLNYPRPSILLFAPAMHTFTEMPQGRLHPHILDLFVLFFEIHRPPPNSARTRTIARDRCAFTVPSLKPMVLAISWISISSTCRSINTVRCRSLSPLTAFQT